MELDRGRSVFFPGKWHVWRREQAARAQFTSRSAQRDAEKIARLERFVERFGAKATKARAAKSKQKEIDRLKAGMPAAEPGQRRPLGFEFLKPARSGRVVVEADGLSLRAGEKELLDDASFALERGEHGWLFGPNGSGEPTLVETRRGRREPAAGRVKPEPRRRGAAYFSHARGRASTSADRSSTQPSRRPGCVGPRRRSCSGGSSSRAGRSTRSRCAPCPGASAAASRSR